VHRGDLAADGELVSVNGVDLFVRRFGDPAKPMLVVVHGGPTWDHSYLLPAVAGLSDLAHVVLFDLRGCGRSCRTPPVGTLPVAALSSDWNAAYSAGQVRPGRPAEAPRVLRDWGGPVLIVQGSREMGFPIGVARRLHEELPASTLAEILDAAHMAHFDNPEAWTAAIRAFLSAAHWSGTA
jgi:pimeloyl-ACP methyl ester carboxylesterase